MVSGEAVLAYRESGLDGMSFVTIPSLQAIIKFPDGDVYESSFEETDEKFFDRIERSKQAGRNLFREEWKKFDGVYDCPSGCLA